MELTAIFAGRGNGTNERVPERAKLLKFARCDRPVWRCDQPGFLSASGGGAKLSVPPSLNSGVFFGRSADIREITPPG